MGRAYLSQIWMCRVRRSRVAGYVRAEVGEERETAVAHNHIHNEALEAGKRGESSLVLGLCCPGTPQMSV